MTDKKIKRLKKGELLEILFYMREEIDNLKKENETLKKNLEEIQKVKISQDDLSKIMEAVQKILSSNESSGV